MGTGAFIAKILTGGFGDTVAKIIEEFKLSPEQRSRLQEAIIAQQTQAIQAVNATMQAEAKSEHWLQWAWRPLFGLTGATTLVVNYVLLPFFQKWLRPISLPPEAWTIILAVVGVSAVTRGYEKIVAAKNGNNK